MQAEDADLALGTPVIGGQEKAAEGAILDLGINAIPDQELHESYFQLVWRRFRRSTVSIDGAAMVLTLIMLAIFADFISPTSISQPDLKSAFIPPQIVHVGPDANVTFGLMPFAANATFRYSSKP